MRNERLNPKQQILPLIKKEKKRHNYHAELIQNASDFRSEGGGEFFVGGKMQIIAASFLPGVCSFLRQTGSEKSGGHITGV